MANIVSFVVNTGNGIDINFGFYTMQYLVYPHL